MCDSAFIWHNVAPVRMLTKKVGGILMDAITCIKTRRSIREFTSKEVSKEVIEDLVQTRCV